MTDAPDSSIHPPVRLLQAAYAVAFMIAAVGVWRALPDVVDDAYITFRYGENLFAGNGLCFNPGQIVEGYSNPLFLFALIPLRALGVSFSVGAKLLGAFSFPLCVVAAGRLVRLLGAAPWQAHVARLAVLASFPLLYYSITGLETGFFAALIACALWRYYAVERRVDVMGGALWLAAALTRPEAIFYPALLGAHELALAFRTQRGERRARLTSVLILIGVAVGFGIFLLWRHSYFGLWLPNTFYAKPMGVADLDPNVSAVSASVEYVRDFFFQSGALLPVLAFLAVQRRFMVKALPVWLTVFGGLLFAFYTGGDWMPAGRYLLPIQVPLVVLGVMGVGAALDWMRDRAMSENLLRGFVVVVMLAAFVMPALKLGEFIRYREMVPYHILNSKTCKEAAIAMREKYGPDHTVVEHRIGALGFYSGMHVVDLFGLVDVEIARIISRHPEYHPANARGQDIPELNDYIARQNPDFVITYHNPTGFQRNVREFYGRTYRTVAIYPLGKDQSWQLYERIDE